MLRCLVFVFAVLLAGCSGPRLPFEKEAPQSAEMVKPPWEAFVKAGPGAENELDLETLNGPSSAAATSPESVAPPPTAVDEARDPKIVKPEKKGVAIRAVAVPSVQGAKGAGNAELTKAMRAVLAEAGWPVVGAPAADALMIRGVVKIGAAKGSVQTVGLEWVVTTPDGKRLGDVQQSNDVPAGSLDKGWGENARFASEAAAEGIFKLIEKYR